MVHNAYKLYLKMGKCDQLCERECYVDTNKKSCINGRNC